MREAVGGSLLMYLIIPILIIFIVFIGFIMNYAAAYRAANYAITRIENCQGRFDDCGKDNDKLSVKGLKDELSSKYNYHLPKKYSIIPLCYIDNGNDSYVFRVGLPVTFELPLVGDATIMTVRAETKSIPNMPTKALSGISQCS